jgi:hypothetical protein
VSYTRQIPPGEEGKITIKVKTAGFGGRKLKKNIRVETSDTDKPHFNLTVVGQVEKFVTISPSRVRLTGKPGTLIRITARIVPEKKYPFKIVSHRARDGKNIKYELTETDGANGKEYRLVVENLKDEKGRYHDVIYLKTDSKIKPELNVRVYGNIYIPKEANKTPESKKDAG